MARRRKIDAKEIGLEATMILGRYFFKSDLLHYGYWTDGIDVDVSNMLRAQQAYSDLLASNIPAGVKTVLDVGCGTGAMAEHLLGAGYEVDCVSPGPFLTERVRARLGDESRIFQCRYEDLDTDLRYDLVMFSESFQYVGLDAALDRTLRFLGPGGHVMISDIFNRDVPGECAVAGGHELARFREAIGARPFEQVTDLDITDETAPNLDLALEINTEVVGPVWQLLQKVLAANYPVVNRILRWKYRKKIEKFNRKFTSGERNGENFRKFRTYRVFVYRKTDGATAPSSVSLIE